MSQTHGKIPKAPVTLYQGTPLWCILENPDGFTNEFWLWAQLVIAELKLAVNSDH